ncbi:hypothetical protein K2173_002607 [Erythroxylum novogranatense]|uniref:Uncharacterized protein n=1 Tax=Erythroxylum novogranatense TaxID=1862640 RepID=A0AAV8SXL7_9ROSI|nr:hypothetical protein K2173_002607 [Erythroxylum novogranatense]
MNWLRPRNLWDLKLAFKATAVIVPLAVAYSVFIATGQRRNIGSSNACKFPAVFNFGDSNSDTGGRSAAFQRIPYPNGHSFFGKQSGPYCDGRVIVDFIAEKLGLPHLSAYLDSIGTNFRHGANFAVGGSTIQPLDTRIFVGGYNPISLEIQVLQFEQFKERTIELYGQGRSSYVMSNLPRPEDFSRALYTLDMGQNDLHSAFESMTQEQVLASIPSIIHHFAQAVEKLYQLGARTFWIHNTGPIGCLPFVHLYYPPKPTDKDTNGCVKSQNEVAQEFNRQLKERVLQLRSQFPDAFFTYTDIYIARYSLFSEAKELGFDDPLEYCCGYYRDNGVHCWQKEMVNGTEVGKKPCHNPRIYISWDSVHYSEAANQVVAKMILDGSMSDPPVPINEACHKTVQS